MKESARDFLWEEVKEGLMVHLAVFPFVSRPKVEGESRIVSLGLKMQLFFRKMPLKVWKESKCCVVLSDFKYWVLRVVLRGWPRNPRKHASQVFPTFVPHAKPIMSDGV